MGQKTSRKENVWGVAPRHIPPAFLPALFLSIAPGSPLPRGLKKSFRTPARIRTCEVIPFVVCGSIRPSVKGKPNRLSMLC